MTLGKRNRTDLLFYFGSRTVALVASVLLLSAPCFAQTAETYRKQAIELSRQKSWDAAIADYRKALELEPNDADTHYNLALALRYKGESKQAAEEFEEAIRLKPNWAEAHFGLGATQYDLGDHAAALKELQAAVRLDPTNVSAARDLIARIDLQQNNPSSAERELKKALAIKSTAELHFELGLVEGQLGKLDLAAAQFRQTIALEPKFARAHAVLGVSLRRQGKHAEALSEFRKAVALDPNDSETQYDLGMELKTSGDNAGAIAAYRKAIELKPDLEKAHYALGIALRSEGQADASNKELNELNGLHDFRTHLAQAKLLILKGVDALKQRSNSTKRSRSSKTRSKRRLPFPLATTTWG